MRVPSLKSLRAIHDADHAAVRRALKMTRAELLDTPAGAEYRAQCHGNPKTWQIRMHVLNDAARTHGVEFITRAGADEWADYLNAGESCAPTVIRWRGKYRVQSVGDFIETLERAGVRFE